MTGKSFGEFLMELLHLYGVEYVFGIPGVHTAELYRGLRNAPITHITPRHEQGAGFAADGYARVSGKPGVCLVVTGPGLCNTITAMGQAHADSIPMLVISGVNNPHEDRSGNGYLHELPNQSALAEQVAAFSHCITGPEEILPVMARAFAVFEGGRPRPVHIQIPLRVMNMDVAHLDLPRHRPRFSRPRAGGDDVAAMVALCDASDRPVILAGGGARGAAGDIRALAEKLDAPVVMTTSGRGILPSGHPLAVNATASHRPVRDLIARADLVLAVGTELGQTDYDIYKDGGVTINGRLIRIDLCQQQLNRNFPADLGVLSDAAAAIAPLVAALPARARPRSLADRVAATVEAMFAMQPEGYRHANAMIASIFEALPDAVVVGDSTQPIYAGNDAITIGGEGRWFNSATGFGTLGYGLPAAIGARRAAPDRPVLAIAGDGGVQFSIAELATAKEAGLPLTLLLWDNSCYGEIRNHMVSAGIEPEGVDLVSPDFALIARAYGWDIARPANLAEFRQVIAEAHHARRYLMVLGIEELRADPRGPEAA